MNRKGTPSGRPAAGRPAGVSRRRFLVSSALAGAGILVSGPGSRAMAAAPRRAAHRDVIIVGSGFGGAVTAWRLAERGIASTIIEKGRRWDGPLADGATRFSPYIYPDGRSTWLSNRTVIPLGPALPIARAPGVLQGRDMGRFRVLTASAYGGGSIIYGGIQARPERRIFDRVFPSAISFDELGPCFDRVDAVLGSGTVPDDVLRSENYRHVRVAEEHAANAGLNMVRIPTATDWDIVREEIDGARAPSIIRGEAVYGVNSGAKGTLDRTYLARAEQSGMLEVKTLAEVLDIGRAPRGGYALRVMERDERGRVRDLRTYTCDYLFLAAGSIGTTSLLVKARSTGTLPDLDAQVGRGFGNNGNVHALRIGPQATGRWQAGPPATGIADLDNPDAPLFIEHPQLPLGVEFAGLLYFGAGLTRTRGHFDYDRRTGRVELRWPGGVDPGQAQVNRALLANMEALNAANGGRVDTAIGRFLLGVEEPWKDDAIYHPLGGCVMGEACDDFGRVRNHDRLYVNDGALLPGSSACANPSLTIAAIAERNIERILAEDF